MEDHEKIKLRLWLLFDLHGEKEPVSISIITKNFCQSFIGKTDKDLDDALKWLKEKELVNQTENQLYYLGVKGSHMLQSMAEKMVFDVSMQDVLKQCSQGPARAFAIDVTTRRSIVDKVTSLAEAGKAKIDYFISYYNTTQSLFRLGLEWFFGNN